MDLWSEYQGITVDGAFPLNKLLQPEGRSAFFSTSNAKGESVFIRLIECHFDEDEILARWRGVQALGHPNFLRIDRFGQFLLDDTTVVYAAFERVDMDLGQVLERGRLSPADANQIGLSVVSALEALHAQGFVHEHVESKNIFAVGEAVKLRSDCIRETPEGEAGLDARRRDVHDLAQVLAEVLLGKSYPAAKLSSLPAPFAEIVSNGMSGTWGLPEIKASLAQHQVPEPKASPRRSVPGAPAIPAPKPSERAPEPPSPKANGHVTAGVPRPPASKPVEVADRIRPRDSRPIEPRTDFRDFIKSDTLARRWTLAGAFLLIVVLCGWLLARPLLHHRNVTAASEAARPAPTAPHAQPASTRAVAPASSANVHVAGPKGTQWRVVAFTYRREDQAQKKALSLSQRYPELKPDVFSPTGRAPWLVTVGGVLQRDTAYALAHQARRMGLPRDTYAQNYTIR